MISDSVVSWFIRLLKGVFIGSGFILPGVSGGALAAVFGLYERMILFLADITKDFKKNVLFFLPVGLGAAGGIFIFSMLLSYFFEVAELQLIWFFIGCIVGTLPALWAQAASREKRKLEHVAALVISLLAAIAFLNFIEAAVGGGIPLNIYSWVMAGAIIGLGMIVPGLSPSNLLLFLQMYAPMTKGIANFDLFLIIPVGVGGLVTVLVFSRLMAYVFDKAYALLFHAIIGFVLASTLFIIPFGHDYLGASGLLCLGAVILGIFLAQWMCRLDMQK